MVREAPNLLPSGVRAYCAVHSWGSTIAGAECPKCVGGGVRWANTETPRATSGVDAAPSTPQLARAKPKGPFSAKATTCGAGHRHPSKVEARVCDRLWVESDLDSADESVRTIYRNVRLPLWSLAPSDTGIPLYATIDFAIVRNGRLDRLIDAKKGRRNREWMRGRKAVEAAYGLVVEEVEA